MHFLQTKTAGYSLVEVLVAVTILLLSIVGPMTIAAKGIQTGRFVGEQTTATYLAQEGVETVMAYRNQYALEQYQAGTFDKADMWGWVGESVSTPVSVCFSANGCNLEWRGDSIVATPCTSSCVLRYTDDIGYRSRFTTSEPGTDSPYTRVIKLTARGAGEVDVVSTVTWNTNLFGVGGERSVELRSSVFNIHGF